ncbi:MAG: undecaprenyl-diphosphatase [Thermotogaceae bacterium]|nr:undecaprenyl-diphosphatase [Thermotogaceae bacterium]MDN5338324.1 undecaprenyl-diphosphatase [Thermotogaceae bacterium]
MIKIFLGIIQGLTEFLPVSSSGHLAIFGTIFQDMNVSFFTLLHLATLLAVVWFLRKYLFKLIVSFLKLDRNAWKIFIYVVISTIPAGFFGLMFNDKIESTFGQNKLIALFLMLTGVVLLLSDFKKEGVLDIQRLGIFNALLIGIFQSFALFPGISRSGVTLVAGLMLGLKREEAVKYSFLISIPAILGAFLLESKNMTIDIWGILGFVTAVLSGFVALHFLRFLTIKRKLRYFAYYCWLIALLILIF